MALSTTTAVYAGGAQTFAVNFALGFIQRSDVQVRVNGAVDGSGDPAYTLFTWIDDSNITVTPTLTIGDSVQLLRTVSKTELKVNFANNTDVTPANLDLSAKHGLMVYQELVDGRVDGAESPVTAADRATVQANAALASAAAALVSENAAAADLVLTNADAAATAADRIAVAADLVQTNIDQLAVAADAAQVAIDKAAVAADLVQTNQDTIDTAADVVAADASAVAAALSETNAGVSETNAANSAASAVNAAIIYAIALG